MAETRILGVRLTREERLTVRRLISDGRSCEKAAAAVRCSTKTVQRLLNTVGGMPPRKPTRSKRHLNRVAHVLNDRPRQTLGWMKPSEKLAELLR